MKYLLACDKFRGSLDGQSVSDNLARGILAVQPDATIRKCFVADGGEGTLEVLIDVYDAQIRTIEVQDALGRDHEVNVGFSPGEELGILEMASCVGLAILAKGERNPMNTSTYGLGQALKKLVDLGAKKIVLAIGGSSTNEGGSGLLEALGFVFKSKSASISPRGGNLVDVEKIVPPDKHGLEDVDILIASDVDNLPCGSNGATYTYARQKGASEKDLSTLEEGMQHYAQLIQRMTNSIVVEKKGYGAAGGVAMSLCEFLGARLVSGSQLVFDALNMNSEIDEAQVIVTGEGKIDHQTLYGKAISPIVEAAMNKKKEIFLVCGVYEPSGDENLDRIPRFELIQLAHEFQMDSYKDASILLQKTGQRIAIRSKQRGD